MHCLTCSYNLANLPTGACPECGRAFDRDDPSTFDSRTRMQRILIRLAASLAISVLCIGMMIAGASFEFGLAIFALALGVIQLHRRRSNARRAAKRRGEQR